MDCGIGTDIIEVKRVEQAIQRFGSRFLDRLFCEEEQIYCNRHKESARHFAGRFAAKEAIVKALGTGFRDGVTWLDITISNDPLGKPIVTFSNALKQKFNSPTILISISHCREYATAFAIAS
ncbi:MAG: holo-ACP synthase [Parachlamydiaceae bacterium]|nr:holo-ACP synthase [Parachlamydiaceae bacterium]